MVGGVEVTSATGLRAPCGSYNIVIATTVITSRKVFLHNQHYSQFRDGMGHREDSVAGWWRQRKERGGLRPVSTGLQPLFLFHSQPAVADDEVGITTCSWIRRERGGGVAG